MSPEVAARAFEPFYTTRSAGQGTGLGLATAYGAVTEAGGDITIDSIVGQGTTMRVLLPAIDQALAQTIAPAAVVAPAGQGETVLVVEDEDAVRDIASRILIRAGYQVITAGVPAEALVLYREHDEIAAVLSDVVMPGMSGFQLAVEMRQLRPAMPILFMSGYPDGLTAGGRELPTGAQLILKPFDAPTLLTRLGELIHAGT
jgi:CheY-like chemotaxis protein